MIGFKFRYDAYQRHHFKLQQGKTEFSKHDNPKSESLGWEVSIGTLANHKETKWLRLYMRGQSMYVENMDHTNLDLDHAILNALNTACPSKFEIAYNPTITMRRDNSAVLYIINLKL